MNRKIELVKAQPLPGGLEPDGVIIDITDNREIEFVHLSEYNKFYDEQATLLFEGLATSLPQGTTDRLMAKLLVRKASDFTVPMMKPKEKIPERINGATHWAKDPSGRAIYYRMGYDDKCLLWFPISEEWRPPGTIPYALHPYDA